MRLGLSNPLIKRLAQLPFQYFLQPRYQNVLFPTLIILCMGEEDMNRIIIQDEMSLEFMKMFIETTQVDVSPRMKMEKRIPRQLLEDSVHLFA